MKAFPTFRMRLSPSKRDEEPPPHAVDLASGIINYNGYPPLSRTYIYGGVWPSGTPIRNSRRERDYTNWEPGYKRFSFEQSVPNTGTQEAGGSNAAEQRFRLPLTEYEDIDGNMRPILTIRNPSPSEKSVSKPSTGKEEVPCGGISPYESIEGSNFQDRSFLMVQPVSFGRRSIDIHRAQYSGFLAGGSKSDTDLRTSSCPSCNLNRKTNITMNNYLDVPCRPVTAHNAEAYQPQAGNNQAHDHTEITDYSDIFGTFGEHDDFTLSNDRYKPRTKSLTTHPGLEDVLPSITTRKVSWAPGGKIPQSTGPMLHPELSRDSGIRPIAEAPTSSRPHLSLMAPDITPPGKDTASGDTSRGSIAGPSTDRKPHRLSWAADATIKECSIPEIVIYEPSSTGEAVAESVTSGHYLFKLGSLKIGQGFAFNARAKSPYPRSLDNPSHLDGSEMIHKEPAPHSKWTTLNFHSRRAYPYLTKARPVISLRHPRRPSTVLESPTRSSDAEVDPIHINVDSFRGRPENDVVQNLNLVEEFRRKNDLLAMETGYRIPEILGSPTRSERIDLFGEDAPDENLLRSVRRRLSTIFNKVRVPSR